MVFVKVFGCTFIVMCSGVFLSLFMVLVKFSWSRTVFDNIFTDIRNNQNFIDRTPLIYVFLQHKYLFINAPSKFGKSTNLDMLSLFLSNHRSKQTIQTFFIQTKIWENEEFVKNNLGEWPVIHFTLKVKGYSSDYEQTLTAFKVSLYNSFIDHMYLLESEKLNKENLKLVRMYTDLNSVGMMDNDMVAKGLSFLTEVLYEHHGKAVILLADEFGRGITEGILNNNADLSMIVDMYSSILNNTFYNESIISRALLSGESWLYGIQGPAITSLDRVAFMQTVEFSRFYGFTYDEVEHLMTKFNISIEEKSEVFKWYCGYSTFDRLFKVCSPYSILQYVKHKKKLVYWTGSCLAPNLIQNMMEINSLKQLILDLVIKKPVNMNMEKDTKIGEVEFLRNKIRQMPQYCGNYFLQILVETGYLAFAEDQGESSNIFLKFPNEEVLSAVIKFTA